MELIEEAISENEDESIINKNKDELSNDIKENFQRLDNILSKDIPDIIANILKETENLNLTEISTLYYNQKINKKED